MKNILIVLTGIIAVFFSSCQRPATESKVQVFAMDTYMELTVYDKVADEVLQEAAEEIYRLEDLLSATDENSGLYRLNCEKTGVASRDMAALWEGAYDIYAKTNGNLDLTVYPAVKAWGFPTKEYRVPPASEIEKCVAAIGMDRVGYKKETGMLLLPDDCEIDFGGVAKGYTGRLLAEHLKEKGITSALLFLGGNVQLIGGKPDGSDFRIEIRNPMDTGERLGVLKVKDVAVVTSGAYERYFEQDGKVYHHIIDPATGCPADTDLLSVTVVAEDGLLADGYATALFVMGSKEAIAFWQEYSAEFEMVLVDSSGNIYVTEGLEECFESQRPHTVINH